MAAAGASGEGRIMYAGRSNRTQAQLRFGRNATPPIIGIQNQTDQAIINARKPAVTPN